MKVIIAEKPSVAKNIADALKVKSREDGYIECEGYLVTWAFGHLLELYDAKDYDEKMAKWKMENFPFMPEEFKYKIKSNPKDRTKVDSGVKKQLNTIKKLIDRKDVTGVISATDADREGELISSTILDYVGSIKTAYRLLLNEWTPDEVQKGLKSLRLNSELQSVADAGTCRQWADWTIGINLTSVATLKYNQRRKGALNIGRVLMPTLKIIYDRDKEIENFKSKDYYKLNATFKTNKNEIYEGMYYENNEDKFENKKELTDLVNSIKGSNGLVSKKDTVRKKEYPPFLFNLSGLQGQITSKYSGWTSNKVLKVAQSLYEKKFITYPRTSSIALEESLVDRTKKVLDTLKKGLAYETEIKFINSNRIFNNKKVESHSAIIPTYMIPTGLTKDENILYEEIKDRFIMQFMPVSEFDETVIETEIKEKSLKGKFLTKGKTIVVEGWKKVQNQKSKDIILPNVIKEEEIQVDKLDIANYKTKPPVSHTERTLLRVMETAGKVYNKSSENEDAIMDAILSGFSIGTSATRADTIEKLKSVGYVEAKGKSLTSTKLGQSLVENFPADKLFDLEYTGRLEKSLSDIEKGKVTKSEFMSVINNFTVESVEKIKKDGGKIMSDIDEVVQDETDVLGLCPSCGQQIVETERNYGCTGWRDGCKYSIWKDDKFLGSMKKKPTKTMVKTLLTDGKALVKGLESKKGNKFDAILSYAENTETGYYNWSMEFPERK